MQIWIHDNKMKKITALNNDVPDMLSYTNSTWHSYLDQATSTFDFTIPKFSNGELHEDLKLINDECFVSFYVNGSYQVFYIATLQEDDFNIQLTCNNTNLEYALEYANPFSSESAQTIDWYLNHMDLLSFAAVEIGNNEISDRKRTLTFDSQETKMNRLQSLMSKFEAEFEFKVELNRDGTYKRIVINIYQEADDTHHGIGTDRKDVVLYYSNGLKGVQVSSDKTQMFNAAVFTGKDGLSLNDVEISEKNADGIEEFYSRKGNPCLYAPIAMNRYPATMRAEGQDNWIRKDFTTEYENVNDLKAYALRTLKKYAYPLVTYTASVQSGFVSQYTDLKLGDTIRIIDNNFVGGLALEARVSEMIISFDNPANNSFVFTNYRKIDNKPSAALQTRIEQAVESKLPYRIELATTGGVTFKNNEGETIVKPSLYKGNLPYTKDVSWHWALGGVVTVGTQYRVQARDITDSEVLTVAAYAGNLEVATTEITLTNVDDGVGVESIDRYFTSSNQSDGVTIEGAEWTDKPPAPTEDGKYLWAYDEITYTDGTVTTTKPAAVGANFDVDAFRAEIAEDLKDVPNREEFENKIAEELANSKAEIETQIETAKTQAESNAKEYADTINQETAKVAELANAAADEIKADLVNVKSDLTSTSLVANNAQAAVDAAKQDLANVASDLNTAKQDLADSVDAVNTKVDSTKAELTQAKQELTNVANDLSQAKTDLQTAVSAVDTKATNLKSDLTQAKQDLNSQAQQLQAQANAQSELTNRVSSVEETADGTKTTVNELTKTVAQNDKDITSVTNRTKTVEDDLANTKTTLTQVQTTANSASQKTATLETGLNGLSAKFDNLKIGGTNLLLYSSDPWQAPSGYYQSSGAVRTDEMLNGSVVYKTRSIWARLAMNWGKHLIDKPDVKVGDEFTYSVYVRTDQETPIKARLFFRYNGQDSAEDMTGEKTITQEWQRFTKTFKVTKKMVASQTKLSWVGFEQTSNSEEGKFVYYACNKLERGNIATDYSPNEADLEQKVAEYKQNADQNYASLSSTVQTLDGQVQSNKTTAEQTAQGFKTRIESLETYKDGESERANAYFESAKTETAKQLTAERTAIANNYVAKSTYTSDVTGIRNDLSATTTTANTIKTNLANYQASNDRAVANLQSNIQTANGDITSLKTKVEAVPGQITSAVSAVESKIPTSAGGRNLALGTSGDWSGDWTNFNGQNNQTRAIYRIYNRGLKNGDKVNVRLVLKYSDIVATDGQTAKISSQISGNVTAWGAGGLNGQSVYLSPDDNEVVLSRTTTITDDHLRNDYWTWGLRVDYVASGRIQWKEAKAEAGDLPTPWSPAPEDTAEQISNLSSQIKQTADGITLLATKTELNTAKNELQSGITTATNKANAAQNTANSAQSTANNAQSTANSNAQTISTHTTQISALNTGLSAKVSQTDFNTLSGRVTTAENNITAKANELSSKITSVEGKIPTSVGGTNYLTNISSNWQNKYVIVNGANAGSFIQQDSSTRISPKKFIAVEAGKQYTVSLKELTNVDYYFKVTMSTVDSYGVANSMLNKDEWIYSDRYTFTAPENCKYVMISVGCDSGVTPGDLNTKFNIKLERGNIPTDYSPAPEDTAEQISNLSSEIKQTADGMTLLATKTELNTAKSDLQSGIGTATNKANAAQNTANSAQSTANSAQNKANSNAQTISTHTTQISALNTGLSAKVSQTDFNTLSGRVTTAENNITAKANELSSKITSVEGKIPTSVGGTNLLLYSADPWQAPNDYYQNAGATKTDKTLNGSIVYKTRTAWTSLRMNFGKHLIDRKNVKVDDEFTYSIYVRTDQKTPIETTLFFRYSDSSSQNMTGGKTITQEWQKLSVTFKVTQKMLSDSSKLSWVGFEQTSNSENGKFVYYACNKLERGNLPSDWTPAPEDYDSKLATAQSEIKQTTDAIKASVSSVQTAASNAQSTANTAVSKADAAQAGVNTLDSTTVKSSSLTINADGIVMKAGKSTTDVANAIGSYFAVNQNAINLFSDKINVKGNMIVNGAITSDKIASKQINTAHLNGKIITADVISSNAVTADAIKAGAVTTDKMSANSINGDRITAGTLDAAKIKAGSITASQIASGTITSAQIKAGAIKSINIEASAITSDKIASNSIDASKIAANSISSDKIVASGITANVIKGGVLQSLNGSTNFELDTGKLFYNNNNTGVFRVQNGASTMGLKFSNTSVTVSGTSRILSRVILGGDRNETTLDDGKWDKGGFSGLVIETIKGAIPAVNEHADSLRAISDTIYFTHTYSADSPTGVSAHGWKMETYAPDSSISGNIVLKPYGINYRQSDIVVGDIRLDNGDGSGYWMRATINTLKACFGHILNGGVSSSALNAIRSELDKISGT